MKNFGTDRNGTTADGRAGLTGGGWFAAVLLAPLLVAVAGGTARAASRLADWTMDSGGGRSTGAVFAVTGSVGQVAGGQARSVSFQVTGGYLGLIAVVPTAGAPALRLVSASPAQGVVVSWPTAGSTGFRLQRTSDLSRPRWTDVSVAARVVGEEQQVRLPWEAGHHYFRLVRP